MLVEAIAMKIVTVVGAVFPTLAAVFLFAQEKMANPEPSAKDGVNLLVVLMCVVNGLFLWLTQRDKSINDGRQIRMEEKINRLEEKERECLKKHESDAERIAELERIINENRTGEHAILPDRRRQQIPHGGPERRRPKDDGLSDDE